MKTFTTFNELHKKYGDIIDAEYTARLMLKYNEMETSLKNHIKFNEIVLDDMWVTSHNAQNAKNNIKQFEASLSIIKKELDMPIPFDSAYAKMVEEPLNRIQEKMCDRFCPRGSKDYWHNLRFVGDCINEIKNILQKKL